MINCTEVKVITERAEERERQKIITFINTKKEETREYCSTIISKQLIETADIPSHTLIIRTGIPDSHGLANVCEKDRPDGDTYTTCGQGVHVNTLVEFIREHGFEVKNELGQYKYSARTYYPARVITIKW